MVNLGMGYKEIYLSIKNLFSFTINLKIVPYQSNNKKGK